MLVRFNSSETGELIMFADVARQLLTAIGKECTARGVFIVEEMLPAAQALRRAVERSEAMPQGGAADVADVVDERGEAGEASVAAAPIALRRRAWPLIDMLERTGQARKRGNIIWEAAADF